MEMTSPVSGRAVHRRSCSIFATTPDDDTRVTPPKEHGRERTPSEHEPRQNTGGEVQPHVERRRPPRPPQPLNQLAGGVLEAQHEEQEDEPDLRARLDEPLASNQGEQPTLAEGEPADEVERNRG